MGGLTSRRSPRGSFTFGERTGFGSIPAWSSTSASVESVFRSDSRLSERELRDEVGDVGDGERVDSPVTQDGEDALEVHAVRVQRAFGDVDA